MKSSPDPHRPVYHYTCDAWLNDPIPFFHAGRHHVFLQHNPAAACWADMHWAHVSTTDFFSWVRHPVALTPKAGAADSAGCWTGCIVGEGAGFHALYTGITSVEPLVQHQLAATSSDLDTWTTEPTPLIGFERKPSHMGPCFRDPHVWQAGERWWMLLGGEQPDDAGGCAYLFSSPDLRSWHEHGIAVTTPREDGYDLECPDFFPLGGTQVLLYSSRHRSRYGRCWWMTGAWNGTSFQPQHHGLLDCERMYAPKSALDHAGRRIVWGWVREDRPREAQLAAGWSGVLAWPRVLSIAADGSLRQVPAPEIAEVRRSRAELEPVRLAAGAKRELAADVPAQAEVGIVVRAGSAQLELRLEWPGDSLTPAVLIPVQLGDNSSAWDESIAVPANAPVEIRLLIDASVFEVFVASQAAATMRRYPTRGARCALTLRVLSGEVELVSGMIATIAVPAGGAGYPARPDQPRSAAPVPATGG